ncbi:MAG: hypothetical protein ACP5I7_05730 [Sulfolobales archaeon]|jgi:hypothetical protein
MKSMHRSLKKGLSDLVIILLILAIAIPAVLVLQSWLNSQMTALPTIEKLRATYTIDYIGSSGTLITINVYNDGNNPINITNISIIYTPLSGSSTPSVGYVGTSTSNSIFRLISPETYPIIVAPGKSSVIVVSGSGIVSIQKIIVSYVSSDSPNIVREITVVGSK